jgi:hypothetical protein
MLLRWVHYSAARAVIAVSARSLQSSPRRLGDPACLSHGTRVAEIGDMSPSDVHVLRVRHAGEGAGDAVVDCPRSRMPMPLLVCEACADCVHVSRTTNVEDWVVVCIAPNDR